MRNLICLIVLVFLLSCVSAGYQENEEAKREAVENKDLDLTAYNQKRDSKLQKRDFWSTLGTIGAGVGLGLLFGKREDLTAEELETQRRALEELYEKNSW